MAIDKPAKLDPETLALWAVTFLATNEERFMQFLTLTGMEPSQLSSRMQDPTTLAAILDYLLNWEPLLIEFAAEYQIQPYSIALARRRLPDPPEW